MRNLLIILPLLLFKPVLAYSFDALKAIGGILGAELCGHASMAPVKICELGAGFLCVNTPDLSVVENRVGIRGTIDVKNNLLSSLTVAVQHEYTNEYKQIKLEKPDAAKDCWQNLSGFCLDENGYFSVSAPLLEKLGPYNIKVTATRAGGAPTEAGIRTSRVIAPRLKPEDIKIEKTSDSTAQVSVDIFHGCQFCDYFGVSTGGLALTLKNVITSADDSVRQVTERTNVAAAGGIFSICLPLGKGTNNINVSVCNAATGYENCPNLNLNPIESDGAEPEIVWIKKPMEFYSADIDPTVTLQFKIDAKTATLSFNREPETEIAASADGTFTLKLEPQVGVNIGSIRSGDRKYSFSFNWGEIVSPFAPDGFWIEQAGGFAVSKAFLTDTTRGLLNDFVKSDDFKNLLQKLPQTLDQSGEQKNPDAEKEKTLEDIKKEIPMCGAGGTGDSKTAFKITRDPVVGSISIPTMEFAQDVISLTIEAKGVDLRASIFTDSDANGQPDKRVMPLIIGFSKISLPVSVRVNRSAGKPKFLLEANSTDCEYKPEHACLHKPAFLVPKNFEGSATKGGSFLYCDYDVEPDCAGVNLINAQTGLISATVLDTINDKLYCDGSAMLTYLIRERMKEVNVPVKFGGRNWTVPVGLDLLGNQFGVNGDGIFGIVPATVGSRDFYSAFPPELQNEGTGFIRKPYLSSAPTIASSSALSGKYDFGIAAGADFLNALLFVLTAQGKGGDGLFDWDINEVVLKKLGFDGVKECDEYDPIANPGTTPPTLCNLRMRVSDILGISLTTGGYYQPKHPVSIQIRGNRKLPPRIEFFKKDGKQYLDVQINDMDIAFHALAVDKAKQPDKFGNLPLELDQNGNPIILSPIVRFKFSAAIAIEFSEIATDETDPSRLALTIRPESKLTQLVFKPVEGGNSTVVPDESIISSFEEKLKIGLNAYSDESAAIKIGVPKETSLDQFGILGLKKLSFGKDGLQLAVEDSQEYIDIFLKLNLTQDFPKK